MDDLNSQSELTDSFERNIRLQVYFEDKVVIHTEEELRKRKAKGKLHLRKMGRRLTPFSCDFCAYTTMCEFAYDIYNINGDCLQDR